MSNNFLILEIGGEGGSIQLVSDGNRVRKKKRMCGLFNLKFAGIYNYKINKAMIIRSIKEKKDNVKFNFCNPDRNRTCI